MHRQGYMSVFDSVAPLDLFGAAVDAGGCLSKGSTCEAAIYESRTWSGRVQSLDGSGRIEDGEVGYRR